VPFLPTILDVTSFFTLMHFGTEDEGGGDALGGAGALSDYFRTWRKLGLT
jgi:hypothetical protein